MIRPVKRARGGREADQRLEQHRHGATPNEQALNKGRTAAGAKAKVDARLLPAVCFEVIAPARFECFRTGLRECRTTGKGGRAVIVFERLTSARHSGLEPVIIAIN